MVQGLPRRLISRKPIPELPDAAGDGRFFAGTRLGHSNACVETSEFLGQAGLPALAWPYVCLVFVDEEIFFNFRFSFR